MAMGRLPFALMGALFLAATSYGRVDADPNKEYNVTPNEGPWMVCVASLTGPEAASTAHSLVLELRSRYQLPAFVFNMGAKKRQEQEEELCRRYERQKEELRKQGIILDQPLPRPHLRIQDECAVLVGNYSDSDDARKALERIRKLEAPQSGSSKDSASELQTNVNVFLTSFVVRNPTLRAEHASQGPDPFLKTLNADEGYSLLKCKKKYTLVIMNFQGGAVIQPQSAPTGFLNKLLGSGSSDYLDASARQAHEIAKVLNDKPLKMEAYVLHTRHGSLVTVGGYDSLEDPQIAQNRKAVEGLQFGAIPKMAHPIPMEVPHF